MLEDYYPAPHKIFVLGRQVKDYVDEASQLLKKHQLVLLNAFGSNIDKAVLAAGLLGDRFS